jgi:uncharacterized membrane protein
LRRGDILVRIEKSIEIRAPPHKVWEMLAFDKAVEWMEGWKTVKYTSEVSTPEDKYRVGASALITEHVKYDFEITESLKNEKIVWRSAGGRAKPNMIRSYTLKPTETGTLVTSVFDYTSPFSVLGKIVDKTGGQRIAEKDVEKSLEKLKSILEK